MKLSARTGGTIVAVILLGIATLFYIDGSRIAHAPVATTASSTSLLASPQAALAPATAVATSSTASTTAKAASTTQKKLPVPAGATLAVAAPEPVVSDAVQQSRNLSAAGGQLLKSLVNIVCLSSDPSIPSISGTGVVIDNRGVILTAAHVAQLFLLEKYLGPDKVSCLIRTGSPARRAYLAEPIYVSPTWIKNNPTTLTTKSPKGTGENDVALLAITDTATSTPLPSSFSYMPLANRDPQSNEKLTIGSYGAQYLSSSELNYSLYPILTFGTVQARYTYGNGTVDVVTVGGSAASQEGSSGGGIVTSDGTLIGTITTSSISGDFMTRLLNSVTVGHLRRSYAEDTGQDLDSTLSSESLPTLISNFSAQANTLGEQLSNTIDANGN